MPPDEDTQIDTALETNTEQQSATETAAADESQTQQGEQQQAQDGAAQQQTEVAQQERRNTRPFQQRIDELTRSYREEQRRANQLEAELQAARARQSPQADAEAEQTTQPQRNGRAIEVTPEVLQELAQREGSRIAADREFDNSCNTAFAEGQQKYPDWREALEVAGSMGILQREVVEDALASGAAHDVLYQLGKNPEEAIRFAKMNPKQRIAEFVKMTVKAPKVAPVSRAAAPINPVNGVPAKDYDPLDPDLDDAEWHRREDERERNQRAAGRR